MMFIQNGATADVGATENPLLLDGHLVRKLPNASIFTSDDLGQLRKLLTPQKRDVRHPCIGEMRKEMSYMYGTVCVYI